MELTLKEVARRLKRAGLTLQVSQSSGQCHVYAHRQDALVGYERGDDIDDAVERILRSCCPAEPIGAVPPPSAIEAPKGATRRYGGHLR